VPRKILGVNSRAIWLYHVFLVRFWRSSPQKTVLQHVYERACQSRYLSDIIIATDDKRFMRPPGVSERGSA